LIALIRIRGVARVLPLLAVVAALLGSAGDLAAQQAPGCQFILGFKTLHDLTPGDVGDCLENQGFVGNGDAQQHTTKGLLAWRKADNWTAFTNGYETWINGPAGLARRLNIDRFPWEAPAPPAAPTPTPGPPPPPTPTPKPIYAWYFKKVSDPPVQMCGAGQAFACIDTAPNEGTQYVAGHVINKDGTPAPGMIVQARVAGINLLYGTTDSNGLFSIPFATNCPAGPIPIDLYLVDGGFALSSYIDHLNYTDCRQAGEFHVDFVQVSQ
jgi:hypothetical protein